MAQERSASAAVDQEILEAAERAIAVYNLCPHRVWSVARNHSDKERALPHLFPDNDNALNGVFATTATARDDSTHRGCTFDFCEQSQLNFTAVTQRHESPLCLGEPCKRLRGLFPHNELNQAARADESTAWQLSGQKTVRASQNYLAISHVWSDGTGAGTWPAGEVNTCLFHFFAYLARSLNCDGIWWDAICIPSDKTARAKAIANMHINYSSASLTLVHDCFLRDMAFQDSETACIAVIMSPWFSRGWTAVELANSARVLVAFNGSEDPTLIDLDDMISDPKTERHNVAAETIRSLRTGNITDLNRLLGILGTRYTSWTKDMPIISALLVGAQVKTSQAADHKEATGNIFQQDIYRSVIAKFHQLGHGHLYHNLPTVCNGTSWCPARLLDLPPTFTEGSLTPDEHGNLVGLWLVVPMQDITPGHMSFGDAHPLVKCRIRVSVQRPKPHRLLFEPGPSNGSRAVIARLTGYESGQGCYQFIGSAVLTPSYTLHLDLVPQKIRIAYDSSTDDAAAREVESAEVGEATTSAQRSPIGSLNSRALHSGHLSVDDDSIVPGQRFSASNQTFLLERPNLDSQEIRPPYREDLEYQFLPHASSVVESSDPRAALIHFAKTGDEEGVVDEMYRESNDSKPHMCDEDGRTAISWAAGQGHTSIVSRLLETLRFHAAPVCELERLPQSQAPLPPVNRLARVFRKICNLSDDEGRTPLAWASAEGHLDTVKLLLRYPDVLVDARDRVRWTPLWYATNNNHTDVMQYLIVAGADKTLKDQSGRSMTERVAISGTVATMKVLLGEPVQQQDIDRALVEACREGRTRIAHLLLEAQAAPDCENYFGITPIFAAIAHGHEDVFRLLLDTHRINLRAISSIPQLQVGAGEDSLLCKAISHKSPLFPNFGSGHTAEKIIKYLSIIKTLIDTQEFDLQVALYLAAHIGDDATIDLLLQTGKVDINARSENYKGSAIFIAASCGHVRALEVLLRVDMADIETRGTWIDLEDHTRYASGAVELSPLQVALRCGHTGAAAMLRRHGAKRTKIPFRKWFASS